MSIEIGKPLQLIEETCGNCLKRTSCAFGKPALKTINTYVPESEKASAIVYIWSKRTELVVKGCPQTEALSQTVTLLKGNQG